jgi:hypothetical protein
MNLFPGRRGRKLTKAELNFEVGNPTWHRSRLGPKSISRRVGIRDLVLTWYRPGTDLVPTWYRPGTDLVPIPLPN